MKYKCLIWTMVAIVLIQLGSKIDGWISIATLLIGGLILGSVAYTADHREE